MRIGVAALGNLLMGDDGVGPRVIQELQKKSLPDNVSLMDLGTPGLGLSDHIVGYDLLILVDAVHQSGWAGSIRTYTRDDITSLPSGPRLSPHAPAVTEALALAEMDGGAPRDLLLIGVVPEDCSMRIGLSPRVEAAVRGVVERVQTVIRAALDSPAESDPTRDSA